ncbi:hypothetical protein BH23ACT9_BH23ACT9_14550 [soil metagenome]
MVCARAVPDGETAQLVGAVIPVRPGEERGLLDLLDHGDPESIAAWVHAREQPPALVNREGEDLVAVTVDIEVEDPAALRRHLNGAYVIGEADVSWVAHHQIDEEESLIRGHVTLDGSRAQVVGNSDQRAIRLVEDVLAAGGGRVVADERTPVRNPDDVAALGQTVPPSSGGGSEGPIPVEAVAQIQDHLERRWCDEPVPALEGFTPRQAAADPTRREQLERLLRSFEATTDTAGGMTMRPDRLRALLDM